ncbi:MAG: ferrochelatase [Planctomycetaceae bacterium]|jgi:ferrochelatase|nr:ferrochelatase [Planctomycetaceae bacterium]
MQSILLVSYGAPERHEEVALFLERLFSGKNVPAERMAAAIYKYEQYAAKTGHYSPLNAECRKIIDGIKQLCPKLPVYWGNLFGSPTIADAVAKMAEDGIEHAVCFATSAFDSPSGNQRYAEELESARKLIGSSAPIIEKLPLPYHHPLFIEAQTDRLLEILAWHTLDFADSPPPYLLFSAHSIPLTDAARSHYVEQLQTTCQSVIEKIGTSLPWELVYQSRSGAAEYWLGPDIKERISTLAAEGHTRQIIVSPIGFFCENMETEYDLDVEIGEHCAALGFSFCRVKAIGTMPKSCRLIAELADGAKF